MITFGEFDTSKHVLMLLFKLIMISVNRALEESMPHLRVLLGRQETLDRGGGDSSSGAANLRWKVLLSNLVCAISSRSHPIALLFEDLHWADDDTFGEY